MLLKGRIWGLAVNVRKICVVFALTILGGCTNNIGSKEILLSYAGGSYPLPENSGLIALDTNGAPETDRDGKPEVIYLERDPGGGYALSKSQTSEIPDEMEEMRLSFHRLRELPVDSFLLQMRVDAAPEGAPKVAYSVARVDGHFLQLDRLSLSEETVARLQNNGIQLQALKGGSLIVSTVDDLEKVVAAWSESRSGSPAGLLRLRFFSNDSDLNNVIAALKSFRACMSGAGHPHDPGAVGAEGVTNIADIDVEKALPACRAAAEADPGNMSVQYALVRIARKQMRWRELHTINDKLIANSFPLAFIMKAETLAYGYGIGKDATAARKLLEQAAQTGFTNADVTLGYYFAAGVFGEKDPESAYRHYKRAADGGNEEASYQVAAALYFGDGAAKNLEDARRYAEIAARADVTEGEYLLGFMKAYGQGGKADPHAGFALLKKAAEKNHQASKYEVARLTFYGEGTSRDQEKGIALLSELADEGYAPAKELLPKLIEVSQLKNADIWSIKEERDLITDEMKQYVFGVPEKYEGTRDKPFIRMGCYRDGMGVTLYWGNVMSDMYPSGDGDAVRVTVRFDKAEAFDLGWSPSEDFTATYPPSPAAGAVLGLGQSLLGAIIPNQNVNFTWTAEQLHRLMLNSSTMVVRASNRGAGNTTIVFDLAGYQDVVRANFRKHCQ